MSKTYFYKQAILFVALLCCGLTAFAQVTTSTISGLVTDSKGEGLVGATVVATHVPSGSRYGTATNALGRYILPAVRVGGPFSVTVTYTGYESKTREGIYATLGNSANVDFTLSEAGVSIDEVLIVASRSDLISSGRTGAATTFSKQQLTSLPTVGARSINAITKYNPNGNGTSFGGQDSRLNNFTIDGSTFNNGFGLGSSSQAGGRTGSTAISLDAIEELQVNVAPFDVRQTGFVGSGINAVTRSGNNEFSGAVYTTLRDNTSTYTGTHPGKDVTIVPGKFEEQVIGLRLGGPIIKNKIFFFVNGEIQRRTEPATTWYTADGPNSANAVQKTRVKYQDMLDVQALLKNKFGYDPGAFENYDNETKSDKFLVRLDFNLNEKNKLTLRYTHHNSEADQIISNSSGIGKGPRRTSIDVMSFQNSGYLIGDNTRSGVLELNTTVTDKIHNTFLAGYDFQDENRKYKTPNLFPTIDILDGNGTNGKTYISVGMDPFTPSNQLNYGNLHFTDNVSFYKERHTITVGANYEHYKSNNLFFPGNNGAYVYSSLADFYAAANSTADTSPVKVNKFQYRYSALPGGAEPLQIVKVNKIDLYGQDELQFTKNLKVTYGMRLGLIGFAQTGLDNEKVNSYDYVNFDEQRGYKIKTSKLPDTKILWEPRVGFNWDVKGKKKTQLRGGAGIFTGRPPYVWVSNQIGNNGVLTGFIDESSKTKYRFTPTPGRYYTPEKPTLPSTFDIAVTDNNYRFPQVWKNNLAIDQKLPLGFVATVEALYNQNVNSVLYFDANLEPTTARFAGPDTRLRYAASGLSSGQDNAVRINDNISRAAVMTTTNEGYYQSLTLKLEYPSQRGLYGMVAHTFSRAKDLMSAGSIASTSWTSAKSVDGNNNLVLGFADQDLPNRTVGVLGYRLEYGGNFGGATQISIGYVGENTGFYSAPGITTSRFSTVIAGDMNGDRVNDNELLFVPQKGSDLSFKEFKMTYKDPATGVNVDKTFTAADQAAAFDIFIEQDEYLKTRRGQYADRNGGLFPMIHRFDVSVVQEFFLKIGGKRNTLQFRADILNVGNMINHDWGVGNNLIGDRPISFNSVTSGGTPVYTMATRTVNGVPRLLDTTFTKSGTVGDVWGAQIGLRYIFN